MSHEGIETTVKKKKNKTKLKDAGNNFTTSKLSEELSSLRQVFQLFNSRNAKGLDYVESVMIPEVCRLLNFSSFSFTELNHHLPYDTESYAS